MPAILSLVRSSDPAALLDAAAGELLDPTFSCARPDRPFPTAPFWLVLRQGGLRDDVIARASARGVTGWWDPPIRIFHELGELLGTTPLRSCGDQDRLALLRHLSAEASDDLTRRLHRSEGHLRAVDQLFGELVSEGVAAPRFTAAVRARAGADSFEQTRDAALAALYDRYRQALATAGLRDGRDLNADIAAAVAADPEGLAERLGGRRELRIFGLADLRGGWRALLAALAASPALDRVTIYSSIALDLGAVCTELPGGPGWADALFLDPPPAVPDPARTIAGIDAPDVERALEEVAWRIRGLIDKGVDPRRIAIVTREARPMVDDAVHVLTRMGVPATARRRLGLREVPAIRAILAVLQGAVDGWDRHGLVEVAEQPYFASGLDAGILNWLGHREGVRGLSAWAERLDEWAARARADEEREARGEETPDLQKRLPASARLTAAAEGVRRFAAQGVFPGGDRPVLGWVQWLEQILRTDPWQISANARRPLPDAWDALRLDLAALRAFAQMLAEWRGALERWGGETLTPVRFGRFVRDLMAEADQDLAIWTPVQVGVQVLEAFAAAYRSFDHLFLVGLEAGRFPKRAPASPLLDETDRAALRLVGLPLEPREIWEARERELFKILVAGSAEVTLCWARADESGSEQLRSAFIEVVEDVATLRTDTIPTGRVRTPAFPMAEDAAAAAQGIHAATIEQGRELGALSPYNGQLTDPGLATLFGDDRMWSATQLEAYAKCPWSYFASRLLRLERFEDPDDSIDPAVRGKILHFALERFFVQARARVGGPVYLREADRSWVGPLAEAALDEALAHEGDGWVGHPAFRGARRAELRRLLIKYLDWEIGYNEEPFIKGKRNGPKRLRTGADRSELPIVDARLVRDGVVVRYRGSIDRVERGVDERISGSEKYIAAVDYKSSEYAVPGKGKSAAWEEGIVLQIPLYAHALRVAGLGELARVEYRTLKRPAVLQDLTFVSVDPKSKELVDDPEAAAQWESALDRVVAHVRRMRAGEFPAEYAPSSGCPPYCPALEICRVAGGPDTGEW